MILKHFSSLFCLHFYCVPAFSACISIASGGKESLISQPLHFYWMYCSPAGLLCPSTFLCAHPYRIPALDCVHFYHVQELPVCICISSSTFLCAHPYGIPALSACIPTNLQHSLHAFFCMSIACVLIWTASPLCAFLLCSSTVGVHFYCIAALFACFSIIPQYYIPALYACISVIFKHFSGCIYTRLYVFHSMRAFHSSFLKEMETLRDPLVGDP